jgi:hypothetical protein
MKEFDKRMREQQSQYKTAALGIIAQGKWKSTKYPHILPEGKWDLNLWDSIRKEAQLYFGENNIAWHKDKHNLLSSQVMCVNTFFPLKKHLDVLQPWLSIHFSNVGNVVDLGFEYIGPEGKDYFNEKGGRGQNRTSSDVSITWLDKAKRKNMLLLVFKFTEPSFGECGKKGNPDRSRCLSSNKVVASPQTQCYRAEVGRTYWDIIPTSESPLRKERLTADRYCPFRYDFYQLMRNQLLAHCIQADNKSGFDIAEFGVIYHADNDKLLGMSHPFGRERNPLVAWPTLLKNPDTFHAFTVQNLIGTIETRLLDDLLGWRTYLKQRYAL